MEINEAAAIGYAVAMAAYAWLAALMMGRWKDRPRAAFIALAAALTAIWGGVQLIGILGYLDEPVVFLVVEWVRNFAWLTILVTILRDLDVSGNRSKHGLRLILILVTLCALPVAFYIANTEDSITQMGIVAGGIVSSALIIFLVEQIYRNSASDAKSGLKYFCVGVLGVFIYDLLIFTLTAVNEPVTESLWVARGYIGALFVIPLGFAARRSIYLALDALFPRQIIFHAFGLIGIGVFISILMAGDYYVRTYAGTWGDAARIVIFVSAMSVLVIGIISATTRARVRVFLMKSFFQYKYDYRKEWLRFIGTLSDSDLDDVAVTAVRAIAQIVNSPGGIAWVNDPEGADYIPVGAWGIDNPAISSVSRESKLVRFLKLRKWIVDLNEMKKHPARYGGLSIEPWFDESGDWWLVVPLILDTRLFGFILLKRPNVVPSLNFEDHDLLKTVGRHVATHINQAESDKKLAEASQFGAYNRLTAFLMHDLNNLIAQQSLVVKNAEKFRHNPEFVDDAIDTIAHSVARMRRLMEQLTSRSSESVFKRVDLRDVVQSAIKRVATGTPVPELASGSDRMYVRADPDKLISVFEHLLRNAQDATTSAGQITVSMTTSESTVTIQISDTGHGMTTKFIRERLFRPFDSTKGSQSMGVGAYQAREYVRQVGGHLDVSSAVGTGTVFSVRLPFLQ